MGNDVSQESQKYGQPLPNDISVTWTKSKSVFPFSARDGHSSCALGNKVYVLGGVIQGEPGQIAEVNDLLVFDVGSETWSKVDVKGDIPIPCSASALTAVGDKLYLFGGLSHEVGWLDSLYVFNTANCEWSQVEAKGSHPSARDKLGAVAIGTKIYYFGGFGPTLEEEDLTGDTEEEEEGEMAGQEGAVFGWFNDLFVYDTVANSWSQPMQMNLGVPTPRAAHSMSGVEKNLIIFGGKDAEARQNDLHIFNTDSRKWDTESKFRGRQPEPRSFHSATVVGNRVVILGGRGLTNQHYADIHILDTEKKEWLQPAVQGDIPLGRGLHSAVVAGNQLVVFGGSANIDPETNQCTDIFSDTYLVKTADILKGSSHSDQGASESPVKQNGGTNGV
ncbi:host cell factor 2-like [Liolophura sinensis]|uniref:host cell factor 2-like n=1 Tax=Liolophura sinensis TaxID=3198878 RepID=UPI0031591A8E